MADRENAIKRLKYLHDVEHWTPSESSDEAKARRTITKEAIELLKVQEPVPPKGIHKCIYGGWLNGWCGHCGQWVERYHSYCWHCGQALDWSEYEGREQIDWDEYMSHSKERAMRFGDRLGANK